MKRRSNQPFWFVGKQSPINILLKMYLVDISFEQWQWQATLLKCIVCPGAAASTLNMIQVTFDFAKKHNHKIKTKTIIKL